MRLKPRRNGNNRKEEELGKLEIMCSSRPTFPITTFYVHIPVVTFSDCSKYVDILITCMVFLFAQVNQHELVILQIGYISAGSDHDGDKTSQGHAATGERHAVRDAETTRGTQQRVGGGSGERDGGNIHTVTVFISIPWQTKSCEF